MKENVKSLNEGLFTDLKLQELETRLETDPLLPSASLGLFIPEPSDMECFTCYLCFTCEFSL